MTPENLIPFAIGGASALVGALICYFPARAGKTTISLIILALLAALFAWNWVKANQAIGWDALGYFLFAILFIAPAFVGGAVATYVARHRARKASPDLPS